MNPNEQLYWWCPVCLSNVDILLAHNIGIFCIQCGSKVEVPKNIPEPIFYDDEDEDWKEFPHEEEPEVIEITDTKRIKGSLL